MSSIAFIFGKIKRVLLVLLVLVFGSLAAVGIAQINQTLKGNVSEAVNKFWTKAMEIDFAITGPGAKSERALNVLHAHAGIRSVDSVLSPTSIMLGAYDSENQDGFVGIRELETALNTEFPIIQIYCAWGSKEEQQFPEEKIRSILNLGSVPLITWEPWLNTFNEEHYTGKKDSLHRDKNGLMEIALGYYDGYIQSWASRVAMLGYPVFIRLGHEMNDPYRYPWGPQNNTSADFIKAWQHVHGIFQSYGAKNAVWVWSPNITMEGYEDFYPGDEFVDYTGTNVLNFGNSIRWSTWQSFEERFDKHYGALAKLNKPIMIAELGSLSVGGDKAKWFKDALRDFPNRYPKVKALLFFHVFNDETAILKTFNWYFINDSSTVKEIVTALEGW